MTLSRADKRRFIRAYAIQQMNAVKNGTKCSCHAMADVWGHARQYYKGRWNNDEESYVEDVSYVLSGVNEWCTGTDGSHVGKTVFTDSGFKKRLKDGSNQVQHFSAGVQAGFMYGHWFGGLHRLARPDSEPDTELNDLSTAMGAGLDGIGTSLEEVPDKIEKYVCEPKCGICNGGRGR